MDFLKKLWENDFMPHGHCYFWRPDVLWTNVAGDALITLSYYTIPFLLFAFIRYRPDIKFSFIFVSFAVFILACGTTHLLAIVSVWEPLYVLEGIVKLGTAFASMTTVGLLIRHFPGIRSIPTTRQLEESNRKLQEMISQQLKTERELRRSKERFRLVMHSAPIGMGISDLQGNWLEVNRALADMLGYSEEELLNMNSLLMTHPDDRARDVSYVDRFLTGELNTGRDEKRFLKKNGEVIWVILAAALIYSAEGTPEYFICQIVDITEQKLGAQRLEELNVSLEQKVEERTRDLLESNQDMENFIYAVTHDLRLPLTNLEGLTAVLDEELAVPLARNPDAAFAMYMIAYNARRMDQLVRDLLAFSRTGVTLRKRRIDMEHLVREVFSNVLPVYGQKPVTFDLHRLPPAYADPVAIGQVVQNLLDNAFKYASRRDTIHITVEGWKDDHFTVYAVRDNGIGFDPQFTDQLFKLFQRLHTKDEYEGTGVGLATCHRLITKHGGRMWAEGQLGQGARFFFALPDVEEQ